MHQTLGKEAKFGSTTMAVVVLCAKTLKDDKRYQFYYLIYLLPGI